MIESGGDNLTLTFSPALADFYVYVIDVAEGEKIPRKNGPGLVQADILVINKIDLAPYVSASLDVMESDTKVVRGNRPRGRGNGEPCQDRPQRQFHILAVGEVLLIHAAQIEKDLTRHSEKRPGHTGHRPGGGLGHRMPVTACPREAQHMHGIPPGVDSVALLGQDHSCAQQPCHAGVQRRQAVRLDDRVGIDEHHRPATGFARTKVAAARKTRVRSGPDQPNTLKALNIGTAVVHDNDLQ